MEKLDFGRRVNIKPDECRDLNQPEINKCIGHELTAVYVIGDMDAIVFIFDNDPMLSFMINDNGIYSPISKMEKTILCQN